MEPQKCEKAPTIFCKNSIDYNHMIKIFNCILNLHYSIQYTFWVQEFVSFLAYSKLTLIIRYVWLIG